MTTWRDKLLLPNHLLALGFENGVLFLRVVDVEDQEYVFPLDGSRITLPAQDSTDPYSWKDMDITDYLNITIGTRTQNVFEVPPENKDEVIHLFFGVEPHDVLIRAKLGRDGPRLWASYQGPAVGGLLFEYMKSSFYNPDPRVEFISYYSAPKPRIFLINPYTYPLYIRVRLVGRRYKVLPIPPDEALYLEEVRSGRFAMKKMGNLAARIRIDSRKIFGVDLVKYDELYEVIGGRR